MDDNSIIEFGRHKGSRLIEIPDGYLIWYWRENKEDFYAGLLSPEKRDLMVYIEDSFSDNALEL